MLEQQFQRSKIVVVEGAVKRVAATDAGAILQQQAGAGEGSSQWSERFAVVGIRARIEQYFRQLWVLFFTAALVEAPTKVDHRPGAHQPAANAAQTAGFDRRRPEQTSRAPMQALEERLHLAQT